MRLIYLFFLGFTVFCVNAQSKDLSEELQQKLAAISTLSAKFKQQTTNNQEVIESTSGRLSIKKPRRFLWRSQKPYEQEIIADGSKLWVYDKDLEQVTVSSLDKAIDNTPAAFISQDSPKLINDYELIKKEAGGKQYYKLLPKREGSAYQQIVLGFKGETLVYLSVKDQLSQMTRLNLSEVVQNKPINEALFQFKPPAGVDVIKTNE